MTTCVRQTLSAIHFLRFVIAIMVLVYWHTVALAVTAQNFDTPDAGSRYSISSKQCAESDSLPAVISEEPTGEFLRLATVIGSDAKAQNNTITFELTDPDSADQVTVDFDFRITLAPGYGRADGLGFALLNSKVYKDSVVCPEAPLYGAEEPNFAGSLGVGFDIYRNLEHDAIGDTDKPYSYISVHFDSTAARKEVDASSKLDLASGQFIHAKIIMRPGGNLSDVSVVLTPQGGQPVTLIDHYHIPGFTPYEGRVYFGARSGGESAYYDLDNIEVKFSGESTFAFSPKSYTLFEGKGNASITVARDGFTVSEASVGYFTIDSTAVNGADYVRTAGTLEFRPGEVSKPFSVLLIDDEVVEDDEIFRVRLRNPSEGAGLGDSVIARVKIVDEERVGQYVTYQPIIGIHMHLLPTGKVMLWENGGNDITAPLRDEIRLWDPVTEILSTPALPNDDIFCSGHSFMADGKLLVTGGHMEEDNVGLPSASIYDSFKDSWTSLPNMNAGRWYPTNTTLDDGDVLVVSGEIRKNIVNSIPQVWQRTSDSWRNLANAERELPLYPFMFLAPNGKVFNAGPKRDTKYLDTADQGAWTFVDSSNSVHENGSAVMYDDSKILIVGGAGEDNLPTSTAEIINLNDSTSSWQNTTPMAYAREYLTATLLPDGKVIVTGGTRSPDNNADGAVLAAEMWNPETKTWSTLSDMRFPRLYHSAALLLPDGRILISGGGRPAPEGHADNRDLEIYLPPYLFRGTRPTIVSAPAKVMYGRRFFVQTPDATNIVNVNWIRLSSVTHAFNQNQRINRLNFSQASGGLLVTPSSDPNLCPPGHYMLFILNKNGVPSIAKIIQILPVVEPVTPDGLPILGWFTREGSTVDFDDFFLFADHFGLSERDPSFDPVFDIVPDGNINFDDFFKFADDFGKVIANADEVQKRLGS